MSSRPQIEEEEKEKEDDYTPEQLAEIGVRKIVPRAKAKAKAKSKGSGGNKDPAEARRLGLAKCKVQLLKDIEARGGLHCIGRGKQHTLKSILGSRPGFYKPWKEETAAFVDYWKKLDQEKYYRLLDQAGVTPSYGIGNTKAASRVQFTDLDSESDSEPTQATQASTPTPPRRANMVQSGGPRSRVAAAAPTPQQRASAPLALSRSGSMHTGTLLLLCLLAFESGAHLCIAVVIPVNTKKFWLTQAPFKVYSCEQLMGSTTQEECRGVFFKGYIITMKIDPRDVLGVGPVDDRKGQFEFVAQITSDNQVTITAPLLDYHEMGNDDDAIRRLFPNNDLDAATVIEALENHHVKFADLKVENKMQYVLDFGPGVKLSGDVLDVHQGQKGGLLKEEALPTRVRVDELGPCGDLAEVLDVNGRAYLDRNGNPMMVPCVYAYFCGCLYWRVADLNLDFRKLRVAAPHGGTNAAAAMMQRMNIGP